MAHRSIARRQDGPKPLLGVARAYQIAARSIIATFDYAYLVSATLWGFVFFAETPDLLTIGGMILISAAGPILVSTLAM